MSVDQTCICADDGQFYHVSMIWLGRTACLSFDDGEIEFIIDKASRKTVAEIVSEFDIPIHVAESPLIGVRVFKNPAGVKRQWKAFEAKLKAHKTFPRRLLPANAVPTTKPRGSYIGMTAEMDRRRRSLLAADQHRQAAEHHAASGGLPALAGVPVLMEQPVEEPAGEPTE